MVNIEYDHLFVDHLDQPVQMHNDVTYRVLETQVTASSSDSTLQYVFVHRVVAV